jgi:thiosulfate reductase cytochrome b subunit
MADAAFARSVASSVSDSTARPQHAATIRVTHWLTTLALVGLLVSGIEIVISHPRFYWGETGNIYTPALFQLPIPASRASVPTGYGFVLPDQNGWSRDLHFEAAWLLVLTGLVYAGFGLATRHFERKLLPAGTDLRWAVLSRVVTNHLRFRRPDAAEAGSYNVLQRVAYLLVVFAVFPSMIWTGLAMSPAMASAFPGAVAVLGGQQSARTLHFFGSVFLVVFAVVHLVMVWRAGFWSRTRAMIMGRVSRAQEHP